MVKLDEDRDDDDPLPLEPDSEWDPYSSFLRLFATANNRAPVCGMFSFCLERGCKVSTRLSFESNIESSFDCVFSPTTGQHMQ